MKKINLILLLSAVILSVSSCKKDDDATPATTTTVKTTSELLMSGAWKYTASTVNGTSEIEDCDKDDTYEFKANNIVSYNAGSSACDKDDVSEDLAYTLSTDNKTITMDDEKWTITTITENKLMVTTTIEDEGTTYVFVDTYEK